MNVAWDMAEKNYQKAQRASFYKISYFCGAYV